MSDIHELLALKKKMSNKRPHFFRQDYHKKKRLALVWRRPKGLDSKLRKRKAGHGFLVEVGYRSPAAVRGITFRGVVPVIIATAEDFNKITRPEQCALIAGRTGMKKRLALIELAKKKNIKVINYKNVDEKIKSFADALVERKKLRAELLQRREKAKETKAEVKPKLAEKVTAEEKKEQEKAERDKVLTKMEK